MTNLELLLIALVILLLISKKENKVALPFEKKPVDTDKFDVFSKSKRPAYYGYSKGTYSHINKCSSCDLVGLYEDLHEANACPLCGGKVERFGSGIYDYGHKAWLKKKD